MSNVISGGNMDWREQLIVEMRRAGGDPSHLFEVLEGIMRDRAWERLLDERGNPVGSLRRLIEAPPPTGTGQKADKVVALLKVEHRYERDDSDYAERMKALRDDVMRELGEEITLPLSGDDLKSVRAEAGKDPSLYIRKGSNVDTNKAGEQRDYVIATLKRDAPDIAEQVINQEITAQEGKRRYYDRVGIRKRRVTIQNIYDAEQVVRWLEQCELTRDELLDIRDGIDELLGNSE